jgi:hypothetical protein
MDINILGTITRAIPTDDSEVFETIELEGFHINTTSPLEDAEDYQVFPEVPYNVFAGVTTYFYSFEDERQARELVPDAFPLELISDLV